MNFTILHSKHTNHTCQRRAHRPHPLTSTRFVSRTRRACGGPPCTRPRCRCGRRTQGTTRPRSPRRNRSPGPAPTEGPLGALLPCTCERLGVIFLVHYKGTRTSKTIPSWNTHHIFRHLANTIVILHLMQGIPRSLCADGVGYLSTLRCGLVGNNSHPLMQHRSPRSLPPESVLRGVSR